MFLTLANVLDMHDPLAALIEALLYIIFYLLVLITGIINQITSTKKLSEVILDSNQQMKLHGIL